MSNFTHPALELELDHWQAGSLWVKGAELWSGAEVIQVKMEENVQGLFFLEMFVMACSPEV